MDVLVALAFGVPGILTAVGGPSRPWLVVLLVSGMVVLLARRRAPITVLALITALGIAAAMLFGGLEGFDLGVAFAVYAVAVARPSRIAWTILGLAAATLGTAVALRADSGTRTPTLTALGAVLLLGIAIGISVRNRRLHVTDLVERGNTLARDAEQRSRLATATERARIAREMHDVVAHSLSVMIALADGASASIQKSPVAAQTAIGRLSETGRAALADMRRVLGVLHDGEASFEPAPGSLDLHPLVQSYRDAGMPVQLTVSGTSLPTDTGLQLAMYRIVQESLTNALRHTSGSGPVTVVVAHTPGNVDIRVTSPEDPAQDSPKRPVSSTPGGGRGIIGMRERAAIYGGTVDAGPTSLGWRVRADLHWDEENT
jgi:signal transduction histidine kinase